MRLSLITLAISSLLLVTNAKADPKQTDTDIIFKQLSIPAIEKLRNAHIDVNALLSNESNDLIIYFDKEAFPKNTSSINNNAPRTFRSVKNTVFASLSDKTTLMRDYYNSPTSFIRIGSQQDLIKLLRNPYVTKVVANKILKSDLEEPLGLIQETEVSKTPIQKNPNFDGEGSVVAIIDTNFDISEKKISNCEIQLNTPECNIIDVIKLANDGKRKSDQYYNNQFHGSNIASIIHRVAPKTKLIGIDIFTRSWDNDLQKMVQTTSSSALISSLNWVKNNHIKNNTKGYNFVAANSNLGINIEHGHETHDLPIIGELKKINVATVISSGNTEVDWPATEKNAIAVGTVYYTDNPTENFECMDKPQEDLYLDKMTCFSKSGQLLKFLVPGITADNHNMLNTSQAALHVTAAIAVMRAPAIMKITENENLATTLKRLEKTGVMISDRKGFSHPRIDLLAATNSISGNFPTLTYPNSKPTKPIKVKPRSHRQPIRPKPRQPRNPFVDYFKRLFS